MASLLVSSPGGDRPGPGATPSHTTPLQPRVCQLRSLRPGLPPRCYRRLQRALPEMPVATEFPSSSSCVDVAHLNTKPCGRRDQYHHNSRCRRRFFFSLCFDFGSLDYWVCVNEFAYWMGKTRNGGAEGDIRELDDFY
ncbi:hypothetical protein DEO72_LG10g1013 [Vigna unguiculata]|uniref:Uncharacterized protein n=1 Tax=Vigna unguiculata TaxID=3917 RepID=A0A4D6N7J4_VIGUN|nr:hypothetical protein DEO72_LG10g1013 [Vigna unguiculata]